MIHQWRIHEHSGVRPHEGLPKSDVLKYYYEGDGVNGSVVVRPSGTEPKLKIYISVTAESRELAEQIEAKIQEDLRRQLPVKSNTQ